MYICVFVLLLQIKNFSFKDIAIFLNSYLALFFIHGSICNPTYSLMKNKCDYATNQIFLLMSFTEAS